MKIRKHFRQIAMILACCLFLSFIQPVCATSASSDWFDANNAHLEETEFGIFFVLMDDSKHITIRADESNHYLAVAIKYLATPDIVYQWLIPDYPVEFQTDDYTFWTSIIEYAELRMSDATAIEFYSEEVTQNTPATMSSAGADLRDDLVELVGEEYENKYIRSEIMDGIHFKMYETLEFSIRKVRKYSWSQVMDVASLLTGVLGLVAKKDIAQKILGILSVATAVGGSILEVMVSEGSLNYYACEAHYTRYVKMDGGAKYYSQAYKIVSYKGFENADNNSAERAEIVSGPNTKYSHSADYFNNGLFDAAYVAYKTGG